MAKSKAAEPLTQTMIEQAKPEGRELVLFDRDVPGFHVRITSGGAKSFGLTYRVHGRTRKAKLGSWPAMTVAQARDMARDWYVTARKGIDPADQRKATGEMTCGEAWAQFDLSHISRLKPKTADRYRGLWRLHIEPTFGNKPLSALTTESVERLANRSKTAAAKLTLKRRKSAARLKPGDFAPEVQEGAPIRQTEPGAGTANRLLALISKFHGFCGYRGWRPKGDNPSQGIQRFTEVARQPRLTDAQVQALGRAFDRAKVRSSPWAIAAIKALFFSGHRKSEVFGLRWDALHMTAGEAYADLPDSKTGPRRLPLNDAIVSIVRELEQHRTGFPSPYVFQSPDPTKPIADPRKSWEFIRREAGVPWLVLHDFRHVFGSSAVSNGATLDFVQKVMGHADSRTTQRYAAYLTAPLVEGSNVVAGRLAEQIEEGARAGRIVH